MGFYFRKSAKFGPFRLTATKSGLSWSVGVRGFRYTRGPRGQYITMGSNGLYYRKRIDGGSSRRGSTRSFSSLSRPSGPLMYAVESTRLDELSASSPREMVENLRRMAAPPLGSPLTTLSMLLIVVCFGIGVFSGSWGSFWAWTALAFVFFLLAGYLYDKDTKNHKLTLSYNLDPAMQAAWRQLTDTLEAIAREGALWRIAAIGTQQVTALEDLKWGQIRRETLRVVRQAPPGLEINVPVYALVQFRHTLYLLPDLLLVYDEPKPRDWRIGAVQYAELQLVYEEFTDAFDDLAADAPVVGHTWRYTTKSGEPDRRYRDNPRLTLCRAGCLALDSRRGLREWLIISDPAKGQALHEALRQIQVLTDPFAAAHEPLPQAEAAG